jgi:ABC-type antimicrobial peptide transport system permease subunit
MLRRTISESLLPEANSGRTKDRFSRITITLQLIISSILIFSISIFLYQYSYINSGKIGFDRFNVNTVIAYGNEIPIDEIKKVPGVVDIIHFGGDFLPKGFIRNKSVDITTASDKNSTVNFNVFSIYEPEYVDFFKMNILEGRNIFEGEKDACLINKTASLMLNINDSSEMKKILGQRVVGVVSDMYIDSPSIPVFPSMYLIPTPQPWEPKNLFAYRYADGQRESTEKELQRLAKEEFGIGNISLSNMEETYAEYSKSERYLLILLSVMTGVAIAIAVFGTYSIITLACQRRRKEIAIRKVNGASVLDILLLFLREYFLITVAACVVAFPIGAFVMQRWLEQYIRRVSVEWWLFVGLFLLMLLLVLASVLFQVVRAAKQNPAEVVKSE